jgi:hypothetical protein
MGCLYFCWVKTKSTKNDITYRRVKMRKTAAGLISVVVAVITVTACASSGGVTPVAESAKTAAEYAGFKYTASNGTVTITGYTGSAKNVTIPGQINGQPVTALGMRAFAQNQLTGVTIPDSVTEIGIAAFAVNQLTNVTIPHSVIVIGDGAFAQNQLTSVTIPDSVTEIGIAAFSENQLASVTIPDSVTAIGIAAFSENQLTSVTIPDSVTTIGSWAFANNQLTSITIGANVAFEGESITGNFNTVYINANKAAGTYRSGNNGATWISYLIY